MKIVVIGTRGIPNIQGGVETHCQELYPRLVAKGHDVTITRRSSYLTDDNKAKDFKGVKLIDVYAPKRKSLEAIVHTAISVFKAYRLKPDILHVHAVGPSLLIPLAKLFGMKVVMTHHGFDYEREKWGKFAKTMIKIGELFAIKYADGIIVVSDYIANKIRCKYNRHDINVIYNGVNSTNMAELGSDKILRYSLKGNDYIFAMGRLVPEKGFHDLIVAYSNLSEETREKYKLVIAGNADFNDEYSANLRKMAHETPGVIMTGFVKGELLNQLLGNAALFVMPSLHEGLPIALLEALSFGLKVVVSDIDAHKIPPLENSNCYYPVGNVASLSNTIESKLSHQNSGTMVRREYNLDSYNWENIAKSTESLYYDIIKQ